MNSAINLVMSKDKTHSRGKRGAPTQRQLRVGEMLRHALSDILARGELRDPDLEGRSVTITEVQVAPDMRTAVAYCTSLGGRDDATVVDALNRCRSYLRGQLGRAITLKFTPSMTFRIDKTFDEVRSVESLLRSPRVARDLTTAKSEESNGEAT